MKILNLYAGIGGNRKLWDNTHEITAVENNPEIANVYKKFFPSDTVIVADAHDYLLQHFRKFDFIWSSPPCQSHSKTNFFLKGKGIFRYPDMTLYQEILFLQYFFKGKYVVENVQGYYKPLIEPQKIGRHYFWANFVLPVMAVDYALQSRTVSLQANGKVAQRKAIIREAQIPELTDLHGLDLTGIKLKNKRQILRNCVYPEVGKKILDAIKEKK